MRCASCGYELAGGAKFCSDCGAAVQQTTPLQERVITTHQQALSTGHADGLFAQDLIQSIVTTPHFVERDWIKEQLKSDLDEPNCRFLLITGEPGVGKTVFMAWMAHAHSDWLRYFI